jgi:uncharacterized protein YjbJ (UPF0337 family)
MSVKVCPWVRWARLSETAPAKTAAAKTEPARPAAPHTWSANQPTAEAALPLTIGRRIARYAAEEIVMKPSTTDQIQGKVHELKGKAKEKVGQLTNNPDLADEGTDEKISGVVQKKVGQIEKVLEK